MFSATRVHDGLGNIVQYDQSFVSVLDEFRWYDKHKRVELRYLHLPVPLQPADLGVASPSINRKQRHLCKMGWELRE